MADEQDTMRLTAEVVERGRCADRRETPDDFRSWGPERTWPVGFEYFAFSPNSDRIDMPACPKSADSVAKVFLGH